MSVTAAEASDATRESYARKALLGSALGYAMDGFDLLILGFMLSAIAAELHFTPAQSGSLVTWTLIGAVIGGVVFGILSDYFGRIRVLTWTILLFAIFTGLCAFAQGYWDLLIYRTIAGIGLGGEFGIGMALVAEAWPAHKRARASSYVALGWQAGVLSAALKKDQHDHRNGDEDVENVEDRQQHACSAPASRLTAPPRKLRETRRRPVRRRRRARHPHPAVRTARPRWRISRCHRKGSAASPRL